MGGVVAFEDYDEEDDGNAKGKNKPAPSSSSGSSSKSGKSSSSSGGGGASSEGGEEREGTDPDSDAEEIKDDGRPDIEDLRKNDDIVARQIREAAEAETDPELKKKLWEEYYNYKGL